MLCFISSALFQDLRPCLEPNINWEFKDLIHSKSFYFSQLNNALNKLLSACVNCVRWSVTGRYLASCGDDKTILIWQHAGSGGSVFGGVTAAESWRCVATLRSHAGDVLDLAWAPHDAWLASCSVDNTIIVWNALNFPGRYCVLIMSVQFINVRVLPFRNRHISKGAHRTCQRRYLGPGRQVFSISIWR